MRGAVGGLQPGPAAGGCVAAVQPAGCAPATACVAGAGSAWAAAAAAVGGGLDGAAALPVCGCAEVRDAGGD